MFLNTKPLTIVVDCQFGDTGKAKVVDFLAKDYDVVAKFNGGSNAGNTSYVADRKLVLHQVPTGLASNPNSVAYIGNGCVVSLLDLKNEVDLLKSFGIEVKDRIFISEDAHVVQGKHREQDVSPISSKVGTTGKGIGPCYTDKVKRIGSKILNNMETIKGSFNGDVVVVSSSFIRDQIKVGKRVLAMGSQGYGLDVDLGTYPYVTSSNTTSNAAYVGLALPPNIPSHVYGVAKAYVTRVGNGPLTNELEEPLQSILREAGKEYGATTGRPRRCAWLDLDMLKESCEVNGVDTLALTKADVLCGFSHVQYSLEGRLLGVHGWKELNSFEFADFYTIVSKQLRKVGVSSILVSSGPKGNDWFTNF